MLTAIPCRKGVVKSPLELVPAVTGIANKTGEWHVLQHEQMGSLEICRSSPHTAHL